MISFNVPYVPEISKQYALETLGSNHQQGDGPFTARASELISDLVGGGLVLLTPSCTHALEMASMLADLGPGDEVILPAYTFTSAATAVTKFGARPVFVDIEMETKGIDVRQVREAITPKTKAISWVNYAGTAPDIDGLQKLASEFDLLLIEDNAHGLGGTYKGKPLGSFGDFATQSFHATKNIQCGEGGALVVNNSRFIERAKVIREKGTNRAKFLNGEVQKYQWVDKGSSYLLAETLAAILLGQLESFNWIQEKRLSIWNSYMTNLYEPASELKFTIQQPPKIEDTNVAHIFFVTFENEKDRDIAKINLFRSGIEATSHYQPLDTSIEGRRYNSKNRENAISANLSKTILRLPVYPTMELHELNKISEYIASK